ncbi:MAG TPA: hypothetical protein VF331_03060 [Polyangiales bacterium]
MTDHRITSCFGVFVLLTWGCGSNPAPTPTGNGKPADSADAGGANSAGTSGHAGTGGSTSVGRAGSGGAGGQGGQGGGSGHGGASGSTAVDSGVPADASSAADSGGPSAACKALHCTAPKVCDQSGATAKCVCDAGYTDVSGSCKANDGGSCNGDTDCTNAHCVSKICCASACDAPAQCQLAAGATCQGGATCVFANKTDGTSCDDQSVCTTSDHCQGGSCKGTVLNCDDQNPCTTDTCDAVNGCANNGTGVTASCAIDDNCASGYVCQGDALGTCAPTTTKDCSGSNDNCNTGYCDSSTGQCKKTPLQDGLACEDGNLCTSGQLCSAGVCSGGTVTACNDSNPCTDDACNPATGGCVSTNNTATCDDGIACTHGDSCSGGACHPTSASNCGNGSACNSDGECGNGHCVSHICCASACNSPTQCQVAAGATCQGGATCVYANQVNGTTCNDQSVCTASDQCQNGSCTGTTVSCDDQNPCTVDSCNATGGCINNGTGVTITCAPNDNCASNYKCQGDALGTCAPATTKDCSGSSDDCNVGYCDSASGACKKYVLQNGLSCSDGNACTTGETCTAGVCGGGTTSVCNDGNPCTNDSCNPTTGCVSVNNTATCDDGNPCTLGDVCSGGTCQPTSARNCSDGNGCTDDSCNVAKLTGDPCVHANNTASCNDTNSCTTTDVCSGGSCAGSGNACGAHSSACTASVPNVCTCASGYMDNGAGSCVPNVNECASNPCDVNATCVDPSSATGDVQCTCNTGFSGDGKKSGTGCTDINECAGNPCGAGYGTCAQGVPGTYVCTCNSGYTQVGGTCVCDLNGTYAIQIAATMTWSGISNIEDAGSVKPVLYSWALRHQTFDSAGKLHVVTVPCGGTGLDLCGTGNAFIAAEAYTQFLPVQIWGTTGMPTEIVDMTLTKPLPGSAFVSPQSAVLLGISLTDPLGAWPTARTQVGAGTTQVNGAVWLDSDADGKPGVTGYAVPPGGFPVDGVFPDPLTAYPATSAACPRSNAAAARLAYNYWPGVEGLTLRRVSRFYVGSRTIGYFNGSLTSCNLIQGDVKGPANGQMQNEGRIEGCLREVAPSGETDCSGTLTDFYDTANQSAQQVVSAKFILKRVANTATCADVRNTTYP